MDLGPNGISFSINKVLNSHDFLLSLFFFFLPNSYMFFRVYFRAPNAFYDISMNYRKKNPVWIFEFYLATNK